MHRVLRCESPGTKSWALYPASRLCLQLRHVIEVIEHELGKVARGEVACQTPRTGRCGLVGRGEDDRSSELGVGFFAQGLPHQVGERFAGGIAQMLTASGV